MGTKYLVYKGVSVTIAKNGTAFSDYPNIPNIVKRIGWRFPETTRVLSDNKRYRVYYPKKCLGRLFTDIDIVMP